MKKSFITSYELSLIKFSDNQYTKVSMIDHTRNIGIQELKQLSISLRKLEFERLSSFEPDFYSCMQVFSRRGIGYGC